MKSKSFGRETLEHLGANTTIRQFAHLTPILIDDELREYAPGCANHYDRLNGLLALADEFISEDMATRRAREFDDDCPGESATRSHRLLLEFLDAMKSEATDEPLTSRREDTFNAATLDLGRAIVEVLVDGAAVTLRAISEGSDMSDNLFALQATAKTFVQLVETCMTTAKLRDEVTA